MFGSKARVLEAVVRDPHPYGEGFGIGQRRERFDVTLEEVASEHRAVVFTVRLPRNTEVPGLLARVTAASSDSLVIGADVAQGGGSVKIVFTGPTVNQMLATIVASLAGMIESKNELATPERIAAFYRGSLEDELIVPLKALALDIVRKPEE